MRRIERTVQNHAIVFLFCFTVAAGCLVNQLQPFGQTLRPKDGALKIRSITVCDPDGKGGSGSCEDGFDTHQIVLAPDGVSTVNSYVGGGISDEHSSVFPPFGLGFNLDYVLFVASGVRGTNPDIGVLALSGGSGPAKGRWDPSYQWSMDLAKRDLYDTYVTGCSPFASCTPVYGDIFLSAMVQAHCAAPGTDTTFDMAYAAAGSVVADPTAGFGHLLMAYEGVNVCSGSAVIRNGIATSRDFGHTWPTYRGYPYCLINGPASCNVYQFVNLPKANPTQGPQMPDGATGANVCEGNFCGFVLPNSYGRYAVSAPGPSELSAFLDEPGGDELPYLYITYLDQGIGVERARLNRGSAPLEFATWDGSNFVPGGASASVLPSGTFQECGDAAHHQSRSQPSISYFKQTGQYILTFVCTSPGDPINGQSSGSGSFGSAWFWAATSNLSRQNWSAPAPGGGTTSALEITGSWSEWQIPPTVPPDTGQCPDFKGWYPTFMSLNQKPGQLLPNGYVFYLWGCLGGANNGPPPPRQYSSRAFTINFGATDATDPD